MKFQSDDYNPEEKHLVIGNMKFRGFADGEFITIKQKEYKIEDLSLYPEDHIDYSLDKVRVNTPDFSFYVSKGSDTYNMLVGDDGKTKITIEPKEV